MLIKNAMLALPGNDEFYHGDLLIEDGTITEIGKDLISGDDGWDADKRFIFPGGIDAHVHFNDPGFSHREDFYTGTCAAASGGITTVIDMPCTSIPAVTNRKNFFQKLKSVSEKAVIDYGFFCGVSSQSFDKAIEKDISELSDYVLGIKTYSVSGMKSFGALKPEQLRNVMEEAKHYDLLVLIHSEDPEIVTNGLRKAASQKNEPLSFYLSRPEEAEIKAIEKAIEIAVSTDGELHIVHVGTAAAVPLIARYQNITCETAPHYLAFSADDFNRIGSALKVTPPVKSAGNREELWNFLSSGEINFVASDHAPAPLKEKQTDSIWDAYSGIPGTGTMFPYLLSEGLLSRILSLSRFTYITSLGPAKRFGIERFKGSLEIGKDADLVIVDPQLHKTIRGKKSLSKGKLTPFEGMKLQGLITNTMVRGNWVYDANSGIVTDPGNGHFVTRYERVPPAELY